MMNENVLDVLKQLQQPPVLAERGHFLVKLAENQEEIQAALNLRYQVFMEEQGHLQGVKEPQSGIDVDEYDRYCLHLIIVFKDTNEVIGTYRIHPGEVAMKSIGFYSSRECLIENIEKIGPEVLEVGRSCVKPEYRNGAVVALLWTGIGALHNRSHCRYLMGCVSLETADPVIGEALYQELRQRGVGMTEVISAVPRPGFELPPVDPDALKEYLEGGAKHEELNAWIPPLMKGYLRLGVRLAGGPVLDREFGAIDFLILLDFNELNRKYARHFL